MEVHNHSFRSSATLSPAEKINRAAEPTRAGSYNAAEDLASDAVMEYKMLQDLSNSINAEAHLAFILYKKGCYKRAEEMGIRLSQVSEQVLRSGHRHTLNIQSNLALVYSAQLKHDRAKFLEKLVLASKIKELGPRDDDTLSAMGNLAATYQQSGEHHMALAMIEQTLQNAMYAYGHPNNECGNLKIYFAEN